MKAVKMMATPPSGPTSLSLSGLEQGSSDSLAQMRSHVMVINDTNAKDEAKLQAAQQISDNLDLILGSPEYPSFLQQALVVFRKFLRDGSPHFIAEQHAHQVRETCVCA